MAGRIEAGGAVVYAGVGVRQTVIHDMGSGDPLSPSRCGPIVFLICILLLATGPAAAIGTMRCGSRVVSTEDLTTAVLADCGEPALRDVQPQFDPRNGRAFNDTEVWTYNFGPNQLLRLLQFRGGRLVDIDHDGYGFTPPTEPHCKPYDIVGGQSKYRLLAFCGEPVMRRASTLLSPFSRNKPFDRPESYWPAEALQSNYREEWTYNFGARSFLKRVILENGRVVATEDEGRGYDPR